VCCQIERRVEASTARRDGQRSLGGSRTATERTRCTLLVRACIPSMGVSIRCSRLAKRRPLTRFRRRRSGIVRSVKTCSSTSLGRAVRQAGEELPDGFSVGGGGSESTICLACGVDGETGSRLMVVCGHEQRDVERAANGSSSSKCSSSRYTGHTVGG
jgi:hypothetical protein